MIPDTLDKIGGFTAMHPDKNAEGRSLARVWTAVMFIAATALAVSVPVHLVQGVPSAGTVLYVIMTVLLLADVGVRWGESRSLSAYGWRWLLVDVVAAIPFGILFGPTPLDALRLLKLARVVSVMALWWHRNTPRWNTLRLLYSGYWIALVVHWLACGWLALRAIPPESLPAQNTYLRALYWCVTTLASVGYGDITPQTEVEMIYAIIVMAIGVGMFGYVIGNIAHILANLHPSRTRYVETMERLNAFMEYRDLPSSLQDRVLGYYHYRWEKRLGFDESAILAELPPSLLADVSLYLKKDVIEKVPFFKGAGEELVREIALAMQPVIYMPGDYVFRSGDKGQEMFFIGRGEVEVLAKDGRTVQATLRDGEFFGEIALVLGHPRTASVRAVGFCDLYALDKETFHRIIARNPEFAAHIDAMVRERFGHTS
jgi:voltage-gated potassium channel